MYFLPHGSPLFREFVNERISASLISFGLTVSKRRPDCCAKIACEIHRMKKLKLLQLIQGKEKEEGSQKG